MVSGGIGKSSLAHFVRVLAEHESKTVGCHVFLGGVHELEEMLRRTFDPSVEGQHGQAVARVH